MKLILDDDELEIKPIVSKDKDKVIIVEKPRAGNSGKEVTRLTKELIALDSVDSSLLQKELAELHGTSQTLVSYTGRGLTGTNLETRKVDDELVTLINQRKYNIADRATSKLMDVLDLYDPRVVKNESLPDAAAKLASVTERVSQNFQGDSNKGPQFIIFSPRIRDEEYYEVIQVNE